MGDGLLRDSRWVADASAELTLVPSAFAQAEQAAARPITARSGIKPIPFD